MNNLQVSIVIPYKVEKNETYIWMQRRNSTDELNGFLEFPGGKIEKKETSINAAKREVLEETGVTLDLDKLKLNMVYENKLNERVVTLNIFTYEGQNEFRGQWYSIKKIDNFFNEIPPANRIFLKDVIKSIS
jgi:8-oxo-dGTP diphosphatase